MRSTLRPIIAITALSIAFALAAFARAAPGDLVGSHIQLGLLAPQDIAYDSADDVYWISGLFEPSFVRRSADLSRELGRIPSPFAAQEFVTGLTYNSLEDTLLATSLFASSLLEIDKRTGELLRTIPVPRPQGFSASYNLRGLSFDALGDAGRGSVWVVESAGTVLFEMSLDGRLLRTLEHPEDPDGFPGEGRFAAATDMEVIRRDGEIAGFWVTGTRQGLGRALLLDAEGEYTGEWISLGDAGGSVSSILRRRQVPPDAPPDAEPIDVFVVIVESNLRAAVLEAGEPVEREIFALRGEQDERRLTLEWLNRHSFDRIEILDACDVLETLPGDAREWSAELEVDRVWRLRVRAVDGTKTIELGPFVAVVGAGSIRRAADVGGVRPLDVTNDGEFIVVSDSGASGLRIFDRELRLASEFPLDPEFVAEGDRITGVTRSEVPGVYFVYNTTSHRVGRADLAGDVFESFDVALPNLAEDPDAEIDRGFVVGMAFDPAALGGDGALWLVEIREDRLFQIDLTGNVVRSLESPFCALDPKPLPEIFDVGSGGVEIVRSSVGPGGARELWITGSTWEERRMERIVRFDVEREEIVRGSEISTRAWASRPGGGATLVTEWVGDGEPTLLVLTPGGANSQLLEIEPRGDRVPPPAFLRVTQPGHAPHVRLAFRGLSAYDAIEVLRDCEPIARLPGDASEYIDRDVPPGRREYSVRGVVGELTTESSSDSLRVGVGAVLERAFALPARSPSQMTRDPVDGSVWILVDWPGEKRILRRFDDALRFVEERDSTVEAPLEIWTIGLRVAPDGERLIYSIAAPPATSLEMAGQEVFTLTIETIGGERVEQRELDPPRPTNGFVTFPTALTWDARRDELVYLERNSRTFVWIDPDGETIRTVPHPAPPFQNFVFNLGLTFGPGGDTLWLNGANRHELDITKVLEMDLEGRLTGFELDLSASRNSLRDIELVGPELLATGTGRQYEILRIKAFEGLPARFVRGDFDADERVEINDAISALAFLFRGGSPPACLDAIDADDDGTITLTDPIVVLEHLFRGGPRPAPPYPFSGVDPTQDEFECSETP